ncbi:unnamed protein product [Rhizoctonia solani]|uniref:Hydrolase n=1 Tax=Rhizoctonia solani TaxID=456999 RepID=A0A8H3HUB0_9AGAM|nr:unnamed protein product [Rhizoctonia solani]
MPSLLGSVVLGTTALLASVRAQHWPLPEGYHRFAPRTQGIQWEYCDPEKSTHECARFEVPLDWADHSAGKASLVLARYKATKQPKLGTIFVNPGGPGESGVKLIMDGGSVISEASGGKYDIVSWDPRGVGQSVPRADCFATGTEENLFWDGTIPRTGIEARGNFTNQADIDAFYDQVGEVDTLLKEIGKQCVAYSPDTFQYIGTAATVRDMVAMHDILEASKKPINYWGMSYGTVIGIYFVNMFPDRVGQVVLDGVMDPERWANKPSRKWDVMLESTDEAFNGFVTACATAGPSGCAIASKDSNPETVRKYVSDLIDSAYEYKRKAGPAAEFGSSDIRYTAKVFKGMYSPTTWPKLAEELAEIYEYLHNETSTSQTKRSLSNTKSLLDMLPRQTTNGTDDDPAHIYALQGITCADTVDAGNTTTKDVFDFLVEVTRTVSPMFGPQWGDPGFFCHRWPVRAVERYTGPWNKKLANPILVIGNEADPVTPYIMAKKVADALGDSAVLIEQDDYGHVSFAMKSNCTTSALQDYFLQNKLPAQDKLCGTNQVLFPGPDITKRSLNKLNLVSNLDSTTAANTLQDELDKARQCGYAIFVVKVALAAAAGLLLVALLFLCIRGRHMSKSVHGTYIPHGAFEKASEEEGHAYDDPYAPGAGTKSGGYHRIET